MINYIHCHIGELPPQYLIDSFESIYNVDPDSNIFLITDQNIKIEGITILQVNDISTSQTERVMTMGLFSDDPNPLWRRSIFRIFLIRDAMKYLNISSCYHFDSDVLMFQSSKLFSNIINDFDGLYITYHNENEVVFGFSRFGKIEKISQICDILEQIVFDVNLQKEYSSGMPNEMQLLSGIMKRRPDLIKRLNILPNDDNFIFDPSSYGQYFGGTHQGHLPGFAHHTHIIGREIQNGNIMPIIKDKKPYVKCKNKLYPIVNLHIHSKNTKMFLL